MLVFFFLMPFPHFWVNFCIVVSNRLYLPSVAFETVLVYSSLMYCSFPTINTDLELFVTIHTSKSNNNLKFYIKIMMNVLTRAEHPNHILQCSSHFT